jgi:exodeoxyribonuclease-3
MKIATFNVNSIRSRLAHLLVWLEREQPDVACLQELKSVSEMFPMLDIQRLGYEAIWHGQRSWNGVAILAKGERPKEHHRALPGDPTDEQSRYIEATVHGVTVGCLYLPNGNPQPGPKFEYKLAWMDRFIKHAADMVDRDEPVVLCGDYTVVPTDFDIYNPASWRKDALLQPESRERYQQLLDQGWTDAIRKKYPKEAIYTFWDYFRQHWEKNSGLRIDHLLLNRKLAPALVDAGVDRWVRGQEKASDHAPTWVELDLSKIEGKGKKR